jgi:hypothetical protein
VSFEFGFAKFGFTPGDLPSYELHKIPFESHLIFVLELEPELRPMCYFSSLLLYCIGIGKQMVDSWSQTLNY